MAGVWASLSPAAFSREDALKSAKGAQQTFPVFALVSLAISVRARNTDNVP